MVATGLVLPDPFLDPMREDRPPSGSCILVRMAIDQLD
jgi:hypothetical protein